MSRTSTRARTARVFGAVAVTVSVLCLPVGHLAASADGCPDVEVVFARGTTEPPGVGGFGQQFVDALRSRVEGKSLDVYAVNYPASTDFPTAADGVVDASTHIRGTAAACPNTEMVLGGYSQGAAVIGYVTAPAIPAGFTAPGGITGPMPPEVANHVAAVALLGKPSSKFLNAIGAPPIVIGPRYAGKTIDLCAAGDPICSAGSTGDTNAAHLAYGVNGMPAQAADFAAQRL
ncbi:MAG TPA: cutinase family protein [Mycobacterium sp.]|nr:cutinase family protein [Mycobacterium sp.]